MSSYKEEDFDKIGYETDASIVLIYNDRDDILDSIHYMAITKKDGKFYFHNLINNYFLFNFLHQQGKYL